ncbi:unnamed protein product [Periconia digitata]|uniref:Uncharacterized protein n=1 Tax=Periconia digitata TaxID=1303443 RepID=A0A9W4UDZ5_9PLEO|nr:unnamed protein product [Periconia digitata]
MFCIFLRPFPPMAAHPTKIKFFLNMTNTAWIPDNFICKILLLLRLQITIYVSTSL